MSAQFTLKFDGWAPDLQNVALEVDGSSGAVPCADVLNVYYQDAAYRCLPGPNPFGPALSVQALNLLSGYDNIAANNYIYAGTTDGIQILQNGVWASVPIEPSVTVALTGVSLGLSLGGRTSGTTVKITGNKMQFTIGVIDTAGGWLYNGTLTAGFNGDNEVPVVGYVQGSYGSVNPTATYAGVTLVSLTSSNTSTVLSLHGTLPQAYFTTLSFPSIGRNLTASSASFSQASGNTIWLWVGSSGLVRNNTYSVRIIS